MKMALLFAAALALSGCGTVGSFLNPNAQYTYQKTGDDCTLVVESGRELAAGIDVKLTDCDVTVTAGKIENGGSSVGELTELARILSGGKGDEK